MDVAVTVVVGFEVVLDVGVVVEVVVMVGVATELPVAVAVGVEVALGVGDSVGVAVGDGPVNPTPSSFTFCGLPAAASAKLSSPLLNLPFDGGMKVTDTTQLPPAGIVPTQSFESRLKALPVTLTTGADISILP